MTKLATVRSLFDVVLFYLPERWEPHFATDEFDLHDHVKAAAAALGLTTQIVTDQISGANSIHHVPSRHSTPRVTASAHGKLLPPGPVMVPVTSPVTFRSERGRVLRSVRPGVPCTEQMVLAGPQPFRNAAGPSERAGKCLGDETKVNAVRLLGAIRPGDSAGVT
jgi:hypothetical protein